MIRTSLSIILPVFNEPKLIQPSVREICNFMNQHFETYELLIIESGSTDNTGALCDQLANEFPQINVIHEGKRSGFGCALRLGYQNARFDYCWLLTADMPFPLEAILTAVPFLEKYDYIISYRSEDKRVLIRRIQSWVYNILIRAVLGLNVKCVNSAFKVLPTSAMAEMPLISNFWFFDAEILYRLSRAGFIYIQIPVPLIDRSEGNSSVESTAFIKVLREMIAFLRIKSTIPDLRKSIAHETQRQVKKNEEGE